MSYEPVGVKFCPSCRGGKVIPESAVLGPYQPLKLIKCPRCNGSGFVPVKPAEKGAAEGGSK